MNTKNLATLFALLLALFSCEPEPIEPPDPTGNSDLCEHSEIYCEFPDVMSRIFDGDSEDDIGNYITTRTVSDFFDEGTYEDYVGTTIGFYLIPTEEQEEEGVPIGWLFVEVN